MVTNLKNTRMFDPEGKQYQVIPDDGTEPVRIATWDGLRSALARRPGSAVFGKLELIQPTALDLGCPVYWFEDKKTVNGIPCTLLNDQDYTTGGKLYRLLSLVPINQTIPPIGKQGPTMIPVPDDMLFPTPNHTRSPEWFMRGLIRGFKDAIEEEARKAQREKVGLALMPVRVMADLPGPVVHVECWTYVGQMKEL